VPDPFPETVPDPLRILRTFTAYQRTEALETAVDLDLFTAVGEGNTRIEDLARRCDASERGMRALCDHLVVEGFLVKKEGRYGLPEISALYLDRRSSRYLGDSVRFLASAELRDGFERLTEAVRKGGTAAKGAGIASEESPAWVEFARAMQPLARPLAEGLAKILVEDPAPIRRVLDVAAGHGLYGIEIARRRPGAEIVAIDGASVLEAARENAAAAGVSDRYRCLPGSAFEVEWGKGYDLVLLVNILHHFDARAVVRLLKKARAAVVERGRVVAGEAPPNEDRVSPGPPASFALVMLATTPGGGAYTLAEYEAMFREAGLGRPVATPIPDSIHSAIVARR